MNPIYEKLMRCVESVKAKTDFKPKVGIVLGSGLGDYAETMEIVSTVDYKDIDGFPVSTAPGHKGRFVFGYVGDNDKKVPCVAMQGRVHFYEGYDMTDVVLPVRLMKMLGAEILFLTNASGGIRHDLHAGDLMLLIDHVSTFVPSPLRGENIKELGVRFPDMSHVYDEELSDVIRRTAVSLDIRLKEGIYLQTPGPNYESPAEIRMFRTLGADAVGMSTVCEAMAAHHMGTRVVAISCISNLAAGISPTPLSEQEVIDAGKKVAKTFTALVTESIKNF